MNEINLNIDRLIECREKKGFSRRAAAKVIGISQPAYSRYESGTRVPSIQVIREIAKAFDTSEDYLLGRSNSSDSYIITVDKTNDADLYEVVKSYSELENNLKIRVLEYIRQFSQH